MKKVILGMMATILILGFMGCSTMGPSEADVALKVQPGPTMTVATPMVKMHKKAKVTIMGAGFEPGQEIYLLFTDVNGVQSDIGYALKPPPVANDKGAWVTTWSCGRFIKKKLIKEGAYSIMATDKDYNVITQAPVAFYEEEKKKKK
ncbi:MAG: hypothetical protein JRJ29_14100 [Deltaproteobacteria bacterium]|nr:hypothetical protein [Deltaproteobacteria bacterium]